MIYNKKVCARCKKEKDKKDFNKRNTHSKDGLQSWCKLCVREFNKKQNEKYKKVRKNYKERNRMICKNNIMEYLKRKGCIDCGETDILVLQFDHNKNLGKKSFNISDGIRSGHSWENILKEINKCEIRCANCHQRKTAKEQKFYKTKK